MAEDKSRETPDASERGAEKMTEAEIDRNLMESFPASDPPSWTLGTYHHAEPTPPAADEPTRDEKNES
jgi:hypothetical protein